MEKKIFEIFFDKLVERCRTKGLEKGQRIVTDSTLIEADASLDSMVADSLHKGRTVASLQDMTAPFPSRKLTNETHASTTDIESTLAKKESAPKKLKYKVHTLIDEDSRVILDNKVTTGACHETQVYLNRLEYIESKYHLSIQEVITDKGYGAAKNIQSLNNRGITTFIPLFSSRSGQVSKIEEYGFTYNKEYNNYQCLSGKYLKFCAANDRSTIYLSKPNEYKNCHLNFTCVLSKRKKTHARYIYRSSDQIL